MKISFVNTRIEVYPPIGLCYLSSYLKRELPGAVVSLVELIAGSNLGNGAEKILAGNPDLVGITTYSVGFSEIVSLCAELKRRRPDLLIVLGGPHISSLPQSLPEHADLGVLGEGERTLLELCRAVSLANGKPQSAALSTIAGLCYRDGDRIRESGARGYIEKLDDIPPPDLSILNMKWYTAYRQFLVMKGNFRGFVLLTSRGCPYNCRFCQARVQWGNCRYNSAQRVVAELAALRKSQPQLTAVNIIDDLFIGDRKRLREMVRLIRERGLHEGIVLNVNGHANLVNDEVLQLLKSINVVQIAYGFESGSERVLNLLKRGAVTVAQNQKAADLTNAAGIGVGGQFMVGNPGETVEEMQQTVDFIRLNRMSHVHVSVTTPMPGTELWEQCRSQGLVCDSMDWRRLDFGTPDNPDLLYINEATVPHEEFKEALKEVKRAADVWNPVPSFWGNLSYWQIYDPTEFLRRALLALVRMQRQFANKIVNTILLRK